MRIGMVCPYSLDVPGGVQSHVLQLAEDERTPQPGIYFIAGSLAHCRINSALLWKNARVSSVQMNPLNLSTADSNCSASEQ